MTLQVVAAERRPHQRHLKSDPIDYAVQNG
jgi:hypothetical protein